MCAGKMEVLNFLDAQPWIRCYRRCSSSSCTPCGQRRFELCNSISWIFQGFSSFFTKPYNSSSNKDGEGYGCSCSCMEGALHLFFQTNSAMPDPAQWAVRVGVISDAVPPTHTFRLSDTRGDEVLVFQFQTSNIYIFDISKVEGYSYCSDKPVFSIRSNQNITKTGTNSQNVEPPSHITLNMRHVSLTLYSIAESERLHTLFKLSELMHLLEKNIVRQKGANLDDHGFQVSGKGIKHGNDIDAAEYVLQYLSSIDRMCDTAIKAIEVCNADPLWTGRLLDNMAMDVNHQHLELSKLEPLGELLKEQLEKMLEEENMHIRRIWKVGSKHLKEKEIQNSTMSFIKQMSIKKKETSKALLWTRILGEELQKP